MRSAEVGKYAESMRELREIGMCDDAEMCKKKCGGKSGSPPAPACIIVAQEATTFRESQMIPV